MSLARRVVSVRADRRNRSSGHSTPTIVFIVPLPCSWLVTAVGFGRRLAWATCPAATRDLGARDAQLGCAFERNRHELFDRDVLRMRGGRQGPQATETQQATETRSHRETMLGSVSLCLCGSRGQPYGLCGQPGDRCVYRDASHTRHCTSPSNVADPRPAGPFHSSVICHEPAMPYSPVAS